MECRENMRPDSESGECKCSEGFSWLEESGKCERVILEKEESRDRWVMIITLGATNFIQFLVIIGLVFKIFALKK